MEQKKPTKYIVNFRLSRNKKRLQNKLEISDIYRKFPIYIYDKLHSKLEQKTLTK